MLKARRYGMVGIEVGPDSDITPKKVLDVLYYIHISTHTLGSLMLQFLTEGPLALLADRPELLKRLLKLYSGSA